QVSGGDDFQQVRGVPQPPGHHSTDPGGRLRTDIRRTICGKKDAVAIPADGSAPAWRAGILTLRDRRGTERTTPVTGAQPASVGSTEASGKSLGGSMRACMLVTIESWTIAASNCFGVVGPTRATQRLVRVRPVDRTGKTLPLGSRAAGHWSPSRPPSASRA